MLRQIGGFETHCPIQFKTNPTATPAATAAPTMPSIGEPSSNPAPTRTPPTAARSATRARGTCARIDSVTPEASEARTFQNGPRQRLQTHDPGDLDAVAQCNQRRDRADAELSGRCMLCIGLHGVNSHTRHSGGVIDDRAERAASAAPRRPDLEYHRPLTQPVQPNRRVSRFGYPTHGRR